MKRISICLATVFCVLGSAGCDRTATAPVSPAVSVHSASQGFSIAGQPYTRVDVQANTFTGSRQDAVAIAQDEVGRTVVVWQSRRQESGTYGIFAQRLDVTGRRIGGEVHVNTHTPSHQTRPAVSIGGDGSLWIAWESFGQDGDRGSVVARRFDATLTPLTPEVAVNTVQSGHQTDVAVAAPADGGAVVTWASISDADSTSKIVARRFSPRGAALGGAFRVDTSTEDRNRLPCIGVDGVDRIVIAWARSDRRGRPSGIVARRLDAEGIPEGDEIAISESDGRMHIEPSLAVAPSGAFVVGWATAFDEDYAVSHRRFSADGSPLGPARLVDQGGYDQTSGVAVAIRHDGRHIVSWGSRGVDNHDSGVFGRIYDERGVVFSNVFRVSHADGDGQRMAAASGSQRVVYGDDGRMAFAWFGDSGHGDSSAANVSLLLPAAACGRDRIAQEPVGRSTAVGSLVSAEPHVPPVFDPNVTPLDRGLFANAERGVGGDFGFVGIVDTGWNPPDPHMAVGPDHVVMITNGGIAFFEKNGTMTFSDRIEGVNGFWGAQGAGGFVFDPEVIYDAYSGRFFAMANERFPAPPQPPAAPYFLLAVSDDSDPNGPWHKYRFNVQSESGDTDIDSPNIAVDEEAVYLSADFFGPDKYLVYMVDKAAVLVGDAPTTTSMLMPGLGSLALAPSYDSPPAQYMVEAFHSGTNANIRLYAITNPLGTPTTESVLIPVPTYTQPEDAPSMGTGVRVETFEARVWSCMYRNGSLWATHHIGAGRVVQRWYEFKMNDWPVGGFPELVQSGDIDLGAGIRTYFGSIWADEFNNAAMVFARSSPTEFISIGRTGRLATDPLGQMQAAITLQESTGPSFSGRWGDYSSIVTDPAVPGKFWGAHEFLSATWMTWVASFAMVDVAPPTITSVEPFDGYIDPGRESSDGIALDEGIEFLTIEFDEPVFSIGGDPVDETAFDLSVTGGLNPGIAFIDASANPTIEVALNGVLPVQEYSTITANVEDAEGNAIARTVTYGFLPADINQDGVVNPLDLLRFKQIVNGVFTPPQGTPELFVDLDRSGSVSPLDLLTFKQLINGIGNATQAWAGQSLP